MIATMAPKPIIFALANPVPEILPEEVRAVRDDAIIATGRSDYPNQVNNVLGFPFIFRGALDVRATEINEEMKMAATRALAALAKQDVPDNVAALYGLRDVQFGPDYLIPFPFDHRALLWVAPAVAWAAVASGVASEFVEVEIYREKLEERLGRARGIMRGLINRAIQQPKRVVFPEGEEPKVIRAAAILVDDGIAQPVLLGNRSVIEQTAAHMNVSLEDVAIEDPANSPNREEYALFLWERRQRKGLSLDEARRELYNGNYFGSCMVARGDADALVSGVNLHYPETIRPALQVIGVASQSGHRERHVHARVRQARGVLRRHDRELRPHCRAVGADRIRGQPDHAHDGRRRPASPCCRSRTSARCATPRRRRWPRAAQLLRERDPSLMVDGDMQADTALDMDIMRRDYPFSALTEAANVLIFPNLSAGNIAYKLLIHLGGATAIGPILVGMRRPVHVLERGADVQDIVNMAAVAVVDAQERARTSVRQSRCRACLSDDLLEVIAWPRRLRRPPARDWTRRVFIPKAPCTGISLPRSSSSAPSNAAKANSPTWVHSSPSPRRTPAARPRTSSSCVSRRRSTTSTGARSTSPSRPSTSRRSSATCAQYLDARDELFVQDLYCGADPAHRLSVRYVSPNAWHMAFVRNMFIRPELADLAGFAPNFTVLHAPEYQADPARHGTRTSTFIVLNLARRMILIGGTRYAGELKKAMFTVMNYYCPKPACSPCTARRTSGTMATRRSSSASPAPARPRSPPTRTAT